MKQIIRQTLTAVLSLGLSVTAFADDTDIISTEIPKDTNILFIMDMSGSMEWDLTNNNVVPADPADSRKSILHSALRTVLNDPILAGINVGISSFSGDISNGTSVAASYNQWAHGISYPVSPIYADADTVLDQNPLFTHQGTSYLPVAGGVGSSGYIGDFVPSTWAPFGGTPIVDALYEAALYFRGETVYWGKHDPSSVRSAHPSTYTGLIETTSTTSTSYVCNTAPCIGTACDTLPVGSTDTITPGSKVCTTTSQSSSCYDASCVTTAESNGAICSGPVIQETMCALGVTSCGNNNNCAERVWQTQNVTCNLASATACENDPTNPGLYACTSQTNPGCVTTCPDGVTDEYGVCVNPVTTCNPSTYFSCKKDLNRYFCDIDNYTCTQDVESCTNEVCGNVETSTIATSEATYNSPINQECTKNGIILLSDGMPSLNESATEVKNLIGASYHNNCDSGTDLGRCGNELAKFLANEDNSSSIAGDQIVNTHTIGLALSDLTAIAYLEDLASNGGGHYVTASSEASLIEALKNTIISVSKARTFSSPTYTPSTASRMYHGDDVYLPLFDRGIGPVWPGNLKKFKRQDGKLIDADGNDATDPLGALKDTARDFWSAVAADSPVKSGGVAGLINPATRKAFTDNGSTGSSANFVPLNDGISNAKFGPTVTTSYKQELVKYILGEKPDGTPRHHMGDIIHSKPVFVSYGAHKVLFVGTNEGYLHAINEADGKEIFAFMPSELLKNIDLQYKNDALTKHVYGVDGPITLWHNDDNGNNTVDGSEKAILFFGLRRGGKSYYAIDVTNTNNPKLLWKIDNGTIDSEMGFSWSQPVIAKMKVGTSDKHVMIFGGGYIDDNNVLGQGVETDNGSTLTGRGVYIVNAGIQVPSEGGTLLKKIVTTEKYAVPARIRAIDMSRNGLVDRLYFADTGGFVWRVDFDQTSINTQTPIVSKFADLGAIPASTSRRKFFTEPDVAIFKNAGNYLISVSIGTGERPKPLDYTGDDHFFVMFDKNVLTPVGTTPTITISNLVDATTSAPVLNSLSGTNKGWFTDLVETTGEKVLSTALTRNNMILFNTFGTTAMEFSACGVSNENQSRFYALDILTGGPVLDLDGNGTVTGTGDRSTLIATGEIPGAPQAILDKPKAPGGGACVKGNCGRQEGIATANKNIPANVSPLQRVYWIDEE